MATVTLAAQNGLALVSKPEDVPTYEALADRDYVARLEDVENGYALTPAFAAAIGVAVAEKAKKVAMN
jgi:hypothetical protein